MSTRQNKKRKGRSNVINRERTVTTLTDGPESSFLSTPTHDDSMNVPFSVPAGAQPGHPQGPGMPPPGYALQPAFAPFPYAGYMPPLPGPAFVPPHPAVPPPPFFHQPPPPPPPGQSDLEVLEKLKESIKNGQHEFFRAVPQPATLAKLYLGPRATTQVPPHPEQ
ncbi:hypothetical protein BKA93DRAFT_705698, partial [Sparassis latifolia]